MNSGGVRYWAENIALLIPTLLCLSWGGVIITGAGDGGNPVVILIGSSIVALLALVPSTIAARKGHDQIRWWMYGAAFWPIAVVHSLLLTPTVGAKDEQLAAEGFVLCAFCAEWIRPQATVCRYCGRDVQ